MASETGPTIPPDPGPDNPGSAGLRAPTREDLARLPRPAFHAAGRTKADVYEIDLPGGTVVVKDFRAKPWWIRGFGRLQTAREFAAYRALEGVEGVARCVGRVDAWALALERVDGEQLAWAPDRFSAGERHVRRLRETLDRIHARGVVHLDLRGRENVLVDRTGRIVVLDFAGAVRFRPGSLAHRVIFPRLALIDESAFLKWKLLLAPDRLTRRERAFLDRFRRFVRPLWPVNRKRPGAEDPTP